MISKLLNLSIFLVVSITSGSYSQDKQKNIIHKKADDYLTRLVPFGFNGTVLISRNEEILLNSGYGFANYEARIPNGPEIAYSLGSIVKPFTASLIMKMVENGEINLSDHLNKFFDHVPEDKISITIHHLLSHSSGLPGAIGPDTAYISRENYIDQVMKSRLAFTPGERYLYSNTAYTLLAMIIENITGEEYEHYLNKMILRPAGMTQTGYKIPEWEKHKIAHNYTEGNDNGSFLDREYYPTWHLIGNGGMLSTTKDMYKFYLFIKGDDFLNSKSKELMFKPVFMEDAYGWVNIDNGEIIQHNGGGIDGNGSLFRWFPKDDICMVIFTNTTFQDRPGFSFIQEPLEQIVFGDKIALPPSIDQSDGIDISGLDGIFKSSNGGIMELKSRMNTLIVYPKNQKAVSMLFSSDGIMEWIEWNQKIQDIMSKAIEYNDFSRLGEISNEPDKLKDEILNEIEMEGYQDPSCHVLFTVEVSPEIHLTEVVITDQQSEGWGMLFHLYFKDDKFAGLGVDFGGADLPEISFVPIDRTHFKGYNFRFDKALFMDIKYDDNGSPQTISFNDNAEVGVKKMLQ